MFSKKIWNDRRVQYPNRRQLVRTATNDIVDLQRAEGNVYVIGDKFDANTMNNLEDRINNAFNTYNNKRKPIIISNKTLYGGSSWQSISKQNWDKDYDYKYRQFVSINGISNNDVCLQGTLILSGNSDVIGGVVETTNNGIYVYATTQPSTTTTIQQLVYLKGD